jgi:hypothetical protein
MGQVGTGSGPLIGLSLLFGAVCLSSGTALAVPVTEYITVQPIDVCGAVCAPVNNKGLTSVGAVGFIDPSGVNVTRAVWNQIGVDVTYMPTVRYVNGSFLTLPVDPNSNPLTSTAFKTLSQQDAISTGTVPNPSGGCDAACAANRQPDDNWPSAHPAHHLKSAGYAWNDDRSVEPDAAIPGVAERIHEPDSRCERNGKRAADGGGP